MRQWRPFSFKPLHRHPNFKLFSSGSLYTLNKWALQMNERYCSFFLHLFLIVSPAGIPVTGFAKLVYFIDTLNVMMILYLDISRVLKMGMPRTHKRYRQTRAEAWREIRDKRTKPEMIKRKVKLKRSFYHGILPQQPKRSNSFI